MASKDRNWDVIEMVLKVLFAETMKQMKEFYIDTYKFDPAELAKLNSDVPRNLHVKFDESIHPQKATYDSPGNTLLARFTNAFSLELQSLIVHELTHALCDKNKYDMDIGQSESMAYIAQCQFAKLRTTTGGTRLTDKGNNDQVFDVGWRLADKILGGGHLGAVDVSDMRSAVDAHKWYKGKVKVKCEYKGL